MTEKSKEGQTGRWASERVPVRKNERPLRDKEDDSKQHVDAFGACEHCLVHIVLIFMISTWRVNSVLVK